mgnify:FL=1
MQRHAISTFRRNRRRNAGGTFYERRFDRLGFRTRPYRRQWRQYRPATWKPEDGFNKKFEIIAQVETSGESQQIIPNENMRPRGKDDDRGPDTFVLTGVKLPQQRIDEAEQELLNAGTSYAAKHSSDTTVYDCETNPVYCTHNEKTTKQDRLYD